MIFIIIAEVITIFYLMDKLSGQDTTLLSVLFITVDLYISHILYMADKNMKYFKEKTLNILNEENDISTYSYDNVSDDLYPIISLRRDMEIKKNNLQNEIKRNKEILSSVSNIIFVVREEEITMYNSNFSPYIFKTHKKRYKNIIKFNSLTQKIEDIITFRKEVSEEFFISEISRYFFLSTHHLEQENSILFNLKDITKNRQFEKIQKDFISNVSHELKTPLTNIKGYLIGIEEIMKEENKDSSRKSIDISGVDEDSNEIIGKFLKIIYSNIEKMENLIQKFLGYSKFEGNKIINKINIDIESMVNGILFELDIIITEKKALITTDYSELTSRLVFADKEKLRIVLKNVIENSIIYNEKRPEIHIEISENEGNYIFIIKDNGLGISEIEQEKIFDRFYRIENQNYINISGSGLGLSIVKEIMENYKGKIFIKSILKKGTEFKIIFPK